LFRSFLHYYLLKKILLCSQQKKNNIFKWKEPMPFSTVHTLEICILLSLFYVVSFENSVFFSHSHTRINCQWFSSVSPLCLHQEKFLGEENPELYIIWNRQQFAVDQGWKLFRIFFPKFKMDFQSWLFNQSYQIQVNWTHDSFE
jgi:hypothetical protein